MGSQSSSEARGVRLEELRRMPGRERIHDSKKLFGARDVIKRKRSFHCHNEGLLYCFVGDPIRVPRLERCLRAP